MKNLAKKVFNISKVLFVFGLIFIIVYIALNGIENKVALPEGEYDINIGNFGVNPTWMADADSTEADTIYNSADSNNPDDMLDVAYRLYRLSLTKLAYAKNYGTRTFGNISFSALNLGGKVQTNQYKFYEKVGTPSLNPNQKFCYAYQNIILMHSVTEGTSDVIKKALTGAVNKGVREYSDGTTIFKNNGKNPVSTTYGGKATWDEEIEESAVTAAPTYRLYDETELRDKSNYIINLDTIVKSSVAIVRREVNGRYCYDISFNLICDENNNADTVGSAVYYEAASITNLIGDKLSLYYNSVKITMTICDNGYMTNWSTASDWIAKFRILSALTVEGNALMSSVETLSYDPDETAVVDYREAA